MTEATPLSAQVLPLLAAGDLAALLRLFAGEPILDDPRHGRVATRSAFENYVSAQQAWLAARSARIEPLAHTQANGRSVSEAVLHLAPPAGGPAADGPAEPVALPVAVAASLAPQGAGLTTVRLYHSLWPLTGRHVVRAPLLEPDPKLELSDVVGRYHQALRAGDLATIVDLFEPEGAAREPSGGPFAHQGHAELREFYAGLFAHGGGVALEHCAVTDDGVRCALEYNAVGLGPTPLPPQAGLAVYERGGSGRLAAARIYDDVDIPG